MKIARIELFQVPPRWLSLKLTTDDGLSGRGEPVVEGRAATVASAIQEMEEHLIGQHATGKIPYGVTQTAPLQNGRRVTLGVSG